ncbi:MAG: hypothetical protein IPK07_07010 [Deltaproteobacteria bacterium]|nr:hypothetical protein [Deltaproteobacteria bacterium]
MDLAYRAARIAPFFEEDGIAELHRAQHPELIRGVVLARHAVTRPGGVFAR